MFDDVDDLDSLLTCPRCHTEAAWEEFVIGLSQTRKCPSCGYTWSEEDQKETD